MSGCEPKESSPTCEHGRPIKFGCSFCYFNGEESLRRLKKLEEYIIEIHTEQSKEEKNLNNLSPDLFVLQDRINEIEDKVIKLEFHHKLLGEESFLARLDSLERRDEDKQESLDRLKKVYNAILRNMPDEIDERLKAHASKKPHKCPVCEGRGRRPHALSGLIGTACNACEEKGIVWG